MCENEVLTTKVKVHNAEKVDRSRLTDEKKLATVRVGIFFENAD